MDKKNLLYISAHLPSYKVPQAGQKTARDILESYKDEYNIYFITFVNEIENKYFDKEDFKFCMETYHFKVDNIKRFIGLIKNLFFPLNTVFRANLQVVKIVKDLQNRIKFDLIHFEYTSSAYYIDFIHQNCLKVISEHDITYQSSERKYLLSKGINKIFLKMEYLRQKKWELHVLALSDKILVHNSKDKKLLLKEGVADSKITVINPYVNPFLKYVKRNKVQKNSILFWGAMNRRENIDAILWFSKKIFIHVLSVQPDSILYVVGTTPSRKISDLKSEHIFITGYVENPMEYFEKCEVAIAPLRFGAGIKVKVLEYLEAGLPVVSTSVGAEGIDDKNLFITDDPKIFSNQIIEIFKNSSL